MKLNYILSFVLLFVIGLNAQVDPGTENLTHLWTFEDGTADDQIDDAHPIEFVGNNIYVEDGDLVTIQDTTVDPPVADSWLELPGDIIDIASYDEVSVAAWFTSDTVNIQWNALWFFGNDGNGAGVGSDGFCLQPCRGDDRARVWISCLEESAPYNIEDAVNDTTGLAETGYYREYNDGILHHVVCEINSEATQGVLKMYTDGVFMGEDTLGTPEGSGRENNAIFNISPNFARFAHSCYSGDIPWVGRIHEVAIYNKALSDDEVVFLFNKGVTSVEDRNGQLPEAFSLLQNYPNPFNPSTTIRFSLPSSGFTSLKVYDVLGKEVATLVNGMRKAGMNSVQFNAPYSPSGIYFYTLQSGSFTETKKMVLVK
jgi:hypothetical protein